MEEIDEMTKSALQEAGNIGMGNLATALSKMVSREVKINIPTVEMVSLDQVVKEASEGSQKSVVGIHLKITGDVTGGTVILLPKYSAFSFSDLLLKKPVGKTNKITNKETMKLKEMGLRMCSTYMSSVNEFLGTNLEVSKPEIVVNMDGVGSSVKEQLQSLADDFIIIRGECTIPTTNSKKHFNMLFEPEASDVIMAAVMKKMTG
ncbi:CheC, inhibitor of MCP methylation [Methanohalobium evestigatum Z-7303]|uniref:CheC, inhibitor of MCP methylation n=1 Tax=Methanohalobium evestigatum (strain ATCC BAA-1072 / DSM 3721 / NBRC 107634 / OCM 161 / Z-7303) TaxID=644295 RepID=D7E8U5_METEZ|nr:chemotaxis protein CheC [Methanohalobium evestigatum]ADI73766.1 CheC, inhibitor of MCP methylation [Methanohalobium evestigatum Z-7303]